MITRPIQLTTAVLLSAAFALPGAGQTFESIAQTGDLSPDGDGLFPSQEETFGVPIINNAGQVAFRGLLFNSSLGSSNDSAIFRGAPSGLSLIARESQTAPLPGNGVPGTLQALNNRKVLLNDAGQVAFFSSVSGSSSDQGLFVGNGNNLSSRVRTGQTIPGPVGVFDTFSSPALTSDGRVAFNAFSIDGTFGGISDDNGVYLANPNGTRVQIVREGQAATGGPGSIDDFEGVNANAAGQVAFRADINGFGRGFNNGIFRGDGTSLVPIVREDQVVPDGRGGNDGVIDSVGTPAMNASGTVAFGAILDGGSTNTSPFNDEGIYFGNGGTLTQVVREGQDAPNGSGGFNGFFDDDDMANLLDFNDSNEVAFFTDLRGTSGGGIDDTGIFRGNGQFLNQVAREGDAIPNASGSFQDFSALDQNNVGQVAFLASIDLENGGTTQDSVGIFLAQSNGDIQEVIREGDALFGNTVSSLSVIEQDRFDGNESGFLNDSGQIAFRYELSNTFAGIALWSPAFSGLPGDFDGNNQVEQGDLNLVLSNWGSARGNWENAEGFVTANVDQEELNRVLNNWGNSSVAPNLSGFAAVPEPALAGAVGLAVLGLRRRNTSG
ncbi:MAG: choice-of-anchor tandem repeat NxxGxxAF-containing protein [Planctomycetota bacterium]